MLTPGGHDTLKASKDSKYWFVNKDKHFTTATDKAKWTEVISQEKKNI